MRFINVLLVALCVTFVVAADTESESSASNKYKLAKKLIKKEKSRQETEKSSKKAMKRVRTTKSASAAKKNASYEVAVMKKAVALAKETVVNVKTTTGFVVGVTLANLNLGVSTSRPAFTVTSVNAGAVSVPTLPARELAAKESQRAINRAEAFVQQKLVEDAKKNPEAADELIKMLFNKIYKQDAQNAQKKAFSRVESMMGLKDGVIYQQYLKGVSTPSIPKPTATTSKSSSSTAMNNLSSSQTSTTQSTYDLLNSMNLVDSEQEIPELLRNTLNKNLRAESRKKEEDSKQKPSKMKELKKFLFGEF